MKKRVMLNYQFIKEVVLCCLLMIIIFYYQLVIIKIDTLLIVPAFNSARFFENRIIGLWELWQKSVSLRIAVFALAQKTRNYTTCCKICLKSGHWSFGTLPILNNLRENLFEILPFCSILALFAKGVAFRISSKLSYFRQFEC